MKIKSDLTIVKFLIGTGLIFMLVFLSPKLNIESIVAVAYFFFCLIWIFIGLYKIESFILTNNSITKTNFCGMISKTILLSKITSYEKKYIENDFGNNPLTIIKFYNTNEKYFKFHSTKFKDKDGNTFAIDERFIDCNDLSKLLRILKAKVKDNKKR